MKNRTLLKLSLLSLTTLTACSVQSDKNQNNPPNIIFFLADDMGYRDPACFDGKINTPIMDSLAENSSLVDFELYNLENDPAQQNNLYQQRPELADSIRKMFLKTYHKVIEDAPYWEGLWEYDPKKARKKQEYARQITVIHMQTVGSMRACTF